MQEQQLNLKKPKNKYHSQEDKQGHLDAWTASGLSMSEYCRQNNLSISSLSNWNAQSKSKEKITAPKLKPIEKLTAVQNHMKLTPIEIVLPDGIKIRLSDLQQLASILKIIKG